MKLEDSSIRAEFNEQGGQIRVTVTDLKSGEIWGPSPAFIIQAYCALLHRMEDVTDTKTKIESGDGWVDVTQSADSLMFNLSATVRFTLDNGEVVATVPTERIMEGSPEVSLLYGVHVLPNLQTITKEFPGHLVLPYMNGAICYPERHERTKDRFLIYGEQARWELMPLLPCTGAVRDGSAMLAIVEQGDCDAECYVDVDGKGGGETGFSLRYRYTPIDPFDPIERIMRFVPLRGDDAGYAGMGRRMHQFVLKKSGRGTLAERAAACPELAYAASAFSLKMNCGRKDIGSITGDGPLRVSSTFDQASRQLSLLKEHGIDRLYVQMTAWNLEGHDGCWPTRFPVDPRFGGEEGMRRFVKHGQSLGYQMQVHDNYSDILKRSPDFDPDLCIGNLYGSPSKRGCWAGGINYSAWGLAYTEAGLHGQMRKLKDIGIAGLIYLDALGIPLEVSYNKKHGDFRGRRACAEGMTHILKAGREVFGASGGENGYLYAVVEADYMCSAYYGVPEDPIKELIDTPVPLWLMAVKGHIFCNHHDTFNGAIDFGNDTTVSQRMLKMASLGLMPRSATVDTWWGWQFPIEEHIEAVKLEYDLMVKTLPQVGMSAMVDHRVLAGSMLEGNEVLATKFADGTEILADYPNQKLEINGKNYPLPNDYVKRPLIPKGTRSPLAKVD